VLLEPRSAAVIGKKAILAEDEKAKTEHPAARVLNYHHDIKDLKVVGAMAIEWGYFEVISKSRQKSDSRIFTANLREYGVNLT
jgi:hypothetical protein